MIAFDMMRNWKEFCSSHHSQQHVMQPTGMGTADDTRT